MISHALRHACIYPAATQKGVANICFNFNASLSCYIAMDNK